MKPAPLSAIFLISCTMSMQAAVDYQSIAATDAIVTGVRSDSSTTDSVVLTASYVSGGITYAALYNGSLQAATTAPTASWNTLTPVFGGQTVTSATFYGPNTSLFDPSIAAGDVVAVGSYKYDEGSSGPNADHGVLYEGPVTGGGTWTQIDATPLLGVGETLLNTIAHSTMGDLVVGNYDTDLATGKAFIYNKATDTWTNLNPAGSASVTAYGIWQNGGSTSTSYTIAGGLSDVNSGGVDKSYLVNYDSATGVLSHYKTFNYNDLPVSALISHFDGITGTSTGFNLTGDYVVAGGGEGGFFASVKVNPDGSFGEATWTEIAYPGATVTSGNTVVENNVLGIFVTGGATQSYIATVQPEENGVSMSVSKNGHRAIFTVTNTGTATSSFRISTHTKAHSNRTGPKPPKPPKPAKPRYSITYEINGSGATKSVEAGSATISLAPGESARVVEKAKARGKLAYKRTIRTTLEAASETNASITASAKVKLVLKAD